MKVNKNIVSGSFFIVFSGIIWFMIPSQIRVTNTSSMINAQFLPKMVTLVIFALSVILLVQGIIRVVKKKTTEDDILIIRINDELRVLATFVLLVLYAVIMPHLGFIIASLITCGLVLLIMRVKKWTYYALTFALVVAVYYVFVGLLSIQLP